MCYIIWKGTEMDYSVLACVNIIKLIIQHSEN